MIFFAAVELAAFLLPGLIGVAGAPGAGLAILVVYWAAHQLGGHRAYALWRRRAEDGSTGGAGCIGFLGLVGRIGRSGSPARVDGDDREAQRREDQER